MSEREDVAEVLAGYDIWLHEDAAPLADAVLASDWLRAHDDRIRAEAREQVAREIEKARSAHWQQHLRDHPLSDGRSCPVDYAKHDAYYDAARIARQPAALRAAAGTPTHDTTEEDA